jgi:hypothetical protein
MTGLIFLFFYFFKKKILKKIISLVQCDTVSTKKYLHVHVYVMYYRYYVKSFHVHYPAMHRTCTTLVRKLFFVTKAKRGSSQVGVT